MTIDLELIERLVELLFWFFVLVASFVMFGKVINFLRKIV